MSNKQRDIPVDVVPDAMMRQAFQGASATADAIQGYRSNQQGVPVAPGTPTLRSKQFQEDIRQADRSFDEGVRQADRSFDEDKRRYDQEFPMAQALSGAKIANLRAASAGGGAGGSGLPGTQTERTDFYTQQAMDFALGLYDKAKNDGSKLPLHDTLNIIFTDYQAQQALRGVDVQYVIDALIRSKSGPNYTGMRDYFTKSKHGQQLRPLYEEMFGSLNRTLLEELQSGK